MIMGSKLFDSIIRTSAEGWDTDYPYDEAPDPVELTGTMVDLFEAVLSETEEPVYT
jgi:hypothetical protein